MEEISPEIYDKVQLKNLNLGCNRINGISEQICRLINLQHLNLEKNNLIRIPQEVFSLTSLVSFELSFLSKSIISLLFLLLI